MYKKKCNTKKNKEITIQIKYETLKKNKIICKQQQKKFKENTRNSIYYYIKIYIDNWKYRNNKKKIQRTKNSEKLDY